MNLKTIDTDIDDIFNRLINGQSICPIVLKDNQRLNANFISQQLFALDFDEGDTPEEIIQILTDHNIRTNFMYFSFSHKPTHPKFRIVIILDEVITNIKTRNLIQLGFMNIAKSSDKSCKDAARMFYGGKSGKLISSELNKYADIITVIDSYVTVDLSKPTQSKKSKQLQNFTETPHLIDIYKDKGIGKQIKNYDFENACNISPVLMSFVKGSDLKYHVLLALATNMLHIEGGLKWMENIMNINGNYKPEDFQLLRSVRIRKPIYAPSGIESFDPSLIGEFSNLLRMSRIMQNDIEVIVPTVKVSADIQQFLFKRGMMRIKHRNVLNEDGQDVSRVNILKAATGIGKTEVLLTQENVLIAVDTHALKDEMVKRFKEKGIDVLSTPNTPKFKNDYLNQRLKYFYDNNLGNKARQLLKSASLPDGLTAGPEDMRIAQRYLDEMDAALKSEHTVITTHRRAILSPDRFKHKDHIIFDEDPFKELLPITDIRISTVRKIVEEIENDFFKNDDKKNKRLRADLRTIMTYLNTLPPGYAMTPPPLILLHPDSAYEYLSSRPNGTQIISLIKTDHILKYQDEDDAIRFYAISKRELPNNKQITICSATADRFIYSKLIDEMGFSDFGVVKNQKDIIQYTGKQWSRNQMKKQIEPIETDEIVITYKGAKSNFPTADKTVHFGNTTGFDHLKGEDIVIYGTPIPNPIVLHLYATALGVKLSNDPQDITKEYKEVRLNGFRWYQFTYRNDELAELEIRLALMEIEQAAGRARTARTSSQVTINSSIPTQMADKFKI